MHNPHILHASLRYLYGAHSLVLPKFGHVLTPTHVDACQSGQPGAFCGQSSDCVVITDLDPPHAVCRNEKCQSGKPGAECGQTSDCVVITDLDPPHAVCRKYGCQSGKSGALCGQTSDCVVPPGLDHAVCCKDRCQQ